MGGHAAGAAHRVFHAKKRVQAGEKYHRWRDPALRGPGGCGGACPAGAVQEGTEADVLGDAGGGGPRPVCQESRPVHNVLCDLGGRNRRRTRGPVYPVQQGPAAAQGGPGVAADGGCAPGGRGPEDCGGGDAVALPLVVSAAVSDRSCAPGLCAGGLVGVDDMRGTGSGVLPLLPASVPEPDGGGGRRQPADYGPHPHPAVQLGQGLAGDGLVHRAVQSAPVADAGPCVAVHGRVPAVRRGDRRGGGGHRVPGPAFAGEADGGQRAGVLRGRGRPLDLGNVLLRSQ